MYDTYISMGDYICVSPMKIGVKLKDETWGAKLAEFLKTCDKDLAIVASGSSYNAALLAKEIYAKHLGIHTDVIYTNSFVSCDNQVYDKYILLTQNADEESFEKAISKLNEMAKDYIVVSDAEGYKKTDRFKHEYLDVHNELVVFSTIGFTFELFMLYKALYMAKGLDLKELDKALEVNRNLIFEAECFGKEHQELFQMSRLNIISSGNLMGIAKELALKVKESMMVATSAHETEDFIYAGAMGIKEEDYIFIIADKTNLELSLKLKEKLETLTEHIYFFDMSEKLDGDLLVLAAIAYFQTVCFKMNYSNGNLIPIVNDKYTEFKESMDLKD